jgi:hypothetical protein
VPKRTLLHYDNPALSLEYGPGILNVADLQAEGSGKMPSDCTFRFCEVYRQHYIVVEAECRGVLHERRLVFKSQGAEKQYAKSKFGDVLVFQGKFRVVQNNVPRGAPVVEGVDNNSTAMPVTTNLGRGVP